jgi:hypothetical protein
MLFEYDTTSGVESSLCNALIQIRVGTIHRLFLTIANHKIFISSSLQNKNL